MPDDPLRPLYPILTFAAIGGFWSLLIYAGLRANQRKNFNWLSSLPVAFIASIPLIGIFSMILQFAAIQANEHSQRYITVGSGEFPLLYRLLPFVIVPVVSGFVGWRNPPGSTVWWRGALVGSAGTLILAVVLPYGYSAVEGLPWKPDPNDGQQLVGPVLLGSIFYAGMFALSVWGRRIRVKEGRDGDVFRPGVSLGTTVPLFSSIAMPALLLWFGAGPFLHEPGPPPVLDGYLILHQQGSRCEKVATARMTTGPVSNNMATFHEGALVGVTNGAGEVMVAQWSLDELKSKEAAEMWFELAGKPYWRLSARERLVVDAVRGEFPHIEVRDPASHNNWTAHTHGLYNGVQPMPGVNGNECVDPSIEAAAPSMKGAPAVPNSSPNTAVSAQPKLQLVDGAKITLNGKLQISADHRHVLLMLPEPYSAVFDTQTDRRTFQEIEVELPGQRLGDYEGAQVTVSGAVQMDATSPYYYNGVKLFADSVQLPQGGVLGPKPPSPAPEIRMSHYYVRTTLHSLDKGFSYEVWGPDEQLITRAEGFLMCGLNGPGDVVNCGCATGFRPTRLGTMRMRFKPSQTLPDSEVQFQVPEHSTRRVVFDVVECSKVGQ